MDVSLTIYIAIPVSRQAFFTPTGVTVNRCLDGHLGTLEAKFCQECGKKFQTHAIEDHTPTFAKVCDEYGWSDPRAGFDALLGNGPGNWMVKCQERDSDTSPALFRVLLTPINVVAAYHDAHGSQVYGLAIHIGNVYATGAEDLTTKVLELPLDGFQKQASALKEVAGMLGIEGEPALYPQVSIS